MWRRFCITWMCFWILLSYPIIMLCVGGLWLGAILISIAELSMPKEKRRGIYRSFGKVYSMIGASFVEALDKIEERNKL